MESLLSEAFVCYFSDFLCKDEADRYFGALSGLDWRMMKYSGTKLNRETCVYADEGLTEKAPAIWGEDAVVHTWTPELLELKRLVEEKTGEKYNICLGNRYLNNKQFIAFHSDNEEYGDTKSIASVSLGAERMFTFVKKGPKWDMEKEFRLGHGSLLFMGEQCQEKYRHGMRREPMSENKGVRINITFRKFLYQ